MPINNIPLHFFPGIYGPEINMESNDTNFAHWRTNLPRSSRIGWQNIASFPPGTECPTVDPAMLNLRDNKEPGFDDFRNLVPRLFPELQINLPQDKPVKFIYNKDRFDPRFINKNYERASELLDACYVAQDSYFAAQKQIKLADETDVLAEKMEALFPDEEEMFANQMRSIGTAKTLDTRSKESVEPIPNEEAIELALKTNRTKFETIKAERLRIAKQRKMHGSIENYPYILAERSLTKFLECLAELIMVKDALRHGLMMIHGIYIPNPDPRDTNWFSADSFKDAVERFKNQQAIFPIDPPRSNDTEDGSVLRNWLVNQQESGDSAENTSVLTEADILPDIRKQMFTAGKVIQRISLNRDDYIIPIYLSQLELFEDENLQKKISFKNMLKAKECYFNLNEENLKNHNPGKILLKGVTAQIAVSQQMKIGKISKTKFPIERYRGQFGHHVWFSVTPPPLTRLSGSSPSVEFFTAANLLSTSGLANGSPVMFGGKRLLNGPVYGSWRLQNDYAQTHTARNIVLYLHVDIVS